MSFAALILAAGKSTRMNSEVPKILHPIAGKIMVQYGIDTVHSLKPDKVAVIIGGGMEAAQKLVSPVPTIVQNPAHGTGHAVMCAREFLSGYQNPVLVLYGDTPFLSADSLNKMIESVRSGNGVVILGFYPDDPAQYGRLVLNSNGGLESIVEYADCTPEQKTIAYCNAGLMCIDGKLLPELLAQLKNDNAKGEYYLTDLVAIARRQNVNCAAIEVEPHEVMGINTRYQLALAEQFMQQKLRAKLLESGATLLDPPSVYCSHDIKVGKDVVIEPNVYFGPNVTIGDQVRIKAFSHIEGANIQSGAVIGPFARIRPNSVIETDVHIGNFVEIKNSHLHSGVKAGHLSYLGDSVIGKDTNIGAGTITCNYDGFSKHQTHIGANAFIGSNTSLVAPVSIGDGAIVAAGSVITEHVPSDALGITRAPQTNKTGWAKKFRDLMQLRKTKKAG